MPGSYRINDNSPILRVEDAPMYAHLRKDWSHRQVIHPAPPPTDEELKRQSDFRMHSVAQAAANRSGRSPVISPEQANAQRIAQVARQAAAAAPHTEINAADLKAIARQITTVLAHQNRQDARLAVISDRLDVLEGANTGDTT